MPPVKSITLRGFRSFALLEAFEPKQLCVLIGANGAGKSNFIHVFRLLRAMVDENLQAHTLEVGPESFFFMGPGVTPTVTVRLEFGENVYEFDLSARSGGGLFVGQERVQFTGGSGQGKLRPISSGVLESALRARKDDVAATRPGRAPQGHVFDAVSSWTVYHVHDTSYHAPVRGFGSTTNSLRLADNARNLAAVLLGMQQRHPDRYLQIRDAIRECAPFFDDFVLEPVRRGQEEQVRLDWRQRGSQEPFQPGLLSDGTIRFMSLITALLQPSPPSTLVIDEPELGLHPYAIRLLAAAVRVATQKTQVIIATQSPLLVDEFELNQIVVVEQSVGRTTLKRSEDTPETADWLRDFSLGELWQKNLLGGRPGGG